MRKELFVRRRGSNARSVQTLLERISELEEQVRNLRQIEATLHRNTALFEALIAASHDGIALTRADGTVIRVVHSILGYASPDLLIIDVRLDKLFDLGGRSALVPITVSWSVIGIVPPATIASKHIDAFVASQIPRDYC